MFELAWEFMISETLRQLRKARFFTGVAFVLTGAALMYVGVTRFQDAIGFLANMLGLALIVTGAFILLFVFNKNDVSLESDVKK